MNTTKLSKASPRKRDGCRRGGTYEITSEHLAGFGLPLGSLFYVLPVPVAPGNLVLAETSRGLLVVGIWEPNVGGFDWIAQPHKLICFASRDPVRILGAVVPCPAVKEIDPYPSSPDGSLCRRLHLNPGRCQS